MTRPYLVASLNGAVGATPFNYNVKIAGSPDYLPFAHGARYREYIESEEGVIGTLPSTPEGSANFMEIDFQPDGSFREVQFDDLSFSTTTGAWKAYRERSAALEWLGWIESGGPSSSNDFNPPLTVLPLPLAAGNWTDAGTVEVTSEGTYAVTIEGTVLPRQDYDIPEFAENAYVKDAWIVVFDLEAELGGELAVTMHDTIVYAPALGPVKLRRYEENLDEDEWRLEIARRWPWVEPMMGPKTDHRAEFPRLHRP